MAASQPGFNLDLKPFIDSLKSVDQKIRDTAVRDALDAGAAFVLHAARAGAPQETGILAESIDVKRKVFSESGTGYAVVGPLTSVESITRVPWRYHHLVELGKINRDGSFTPGNPFLKRATESSRPQVQAAMVAVLSRAIEKAGAK